MSEILQMQALVRAFGISRSQAIILHLCLKNARVDRDSMIASVAAMGRAGNAEGSFKVHLCRLNKALARLLPESGARVVPIYPQYSGPGRPAATHYAMSEQGKALVRERLSPSPKRRAA